MKTLWYGGSIYTMIMENDTVEAVLTEDDQIIATGTISELKPSADNFINLHGAAMYPGFVDSHLHMMHVGNKLAMLDLSEATSAEEMLQLIENSAQNLPKDAWLFADGWDENNFSDQRIPTINELDQIHQGPIHLLRVCHHVSLNNSSALRFGNITSETPSPAGGKIGQDKDGNLNGLLFERATELISDRLPKEGQAYRKNLTKLLDRAIDELLAAGLTGGHTEDMHYYGPYTNPLNAFHETIGKRHHFRAHILRHHEVFTEMMANHATFDQPFIEAGAMKIFADGAFGGSTAALSQSYTDDANNKGILIHTDKEMENLVKLARSHHEAVAVHMIGDAAVDQVLNAVEKYPAPAGKRDRFIHASVLRESQIERIAKLPIVIDAQPAFVTSDFPWLTNRLGKTRAKLAYPWRTLLDNDVLCAAGTDAPIENVDPLETIYAAVTRKNENTKDSYFPEQNISRFEAIQMYTIGSAYAANQENKRGLIKPGYDADFSIFDVDLFAKTPEDMLHAKAIKTVVAGRVVYEA